MARRPPVISFVGRSNTGKTTFLEKLIPALGARGVRVATIKHHPHDFEIDREGKDTYRHKKAGAKATMIVSPVKLALVEDLEKELSLAQIVDEYLRGVDLVITEGFKQEQTAKFEVRAAGKTEPPVAEGDPNLLGIITDVPLDAPVPVFSRDDVEPVAELIVRHFGLKNGG